MRPHIEQYENHCVVQVGFAAMEVKGHWRLLSDPERKDILHYLTIQNLALKTQLGAK